MLPFHVVPTEMDQPVGRAQHIRIMFLKTTHHYRSLVPVYLTTIACSDLFSLQTFTQYEHALPPPDVRFVASHVPIRSERI
jgi:hypothetical protein